MLCRAPDVSDQRCLRCSPKLCAWIFPLREVTRRRGHTTSRAIERGPAESWCHRRVRQCHTCATHTLKNGAGRSRGVAPVAVARERAGHLRGGEEHARSERGRAARRHRVPRRARATAAARCSAIAPEPHSRAPGERLPRHASVIAPASATKSDSSIKRNEPRRRLALGALAERAPSPRAVASFGRVYSPSRPVGNAIAPSTKPWITRLSARGADVPRCRLHARRPSRRHVVALRAPCRAREAPP